MRTPILVLDRHGQAALKPKLMFPDRFWPGCSAWMILTHWASLNGLTAGDVRTLIAADPGRNPLATAAFDWSLAAPPWSARRVSTQLKLPSAVIKLASAATLGTGIAGWMSPRFRFCPACLRSGVHTLVHQWRFMGRCPVHGRPLLDTCPQCGVSTDYRFNVRTFRQPGRCAECGYRWIPVKSIGLPPAPDAPMATDLSSLCIELAALLAASSEPCAPAWLPAWFAVFRRLPPSSHPPSWVDRQCAATWARRGFTAKLAPNAADRAWREADACYRGYARIRWRRFSRPERRALEHWARSQTAPMESVCSGTLTSAQFAFLAWRLTWEGQRVPAALFRAHAVPAAGCAAWLALNPEVSQTLPRRLFLAMLVTERRWRQLAAYMATRGSFVFHPGLVPIPEGFRSPPPLNLTRLLRKIVTD